MGGTKALPQPNGLASKTDLGAPELIRVNAQELPRTSPAQVPADMNVPAEGARTDQLLKSKKRVRDSADSGSESSLPLTRRKRARQSSNLESIPTKKRPMNPFMEETGSDSSETDSGSETKSVPTRPAPINPSINDEKSPPSSPKYRDLPESTTLTDSETDVKPNGPPHRITHPLHQARMLHTGRRVGGSETGSETESETESDSEWEERTRNLARQRVKAAKSV